MYDFEDVWILINNLIFKFLPKNEPLPTQYNTGTVQYIMIFIH